jgi:stearoyl-CoA desaturase (delta-9 desaturase)
MSILKSGTLYGNPLNPLFDVHLPPAIPAAPAVQRISLLVRVINIVVMALPPAGLIVGVVMMWGRHLSFVHLCVFVGMYLITGFGITVGYHRLFTHKSFETGRWMKLLLAICGSMAVEGPVLKWCAVHRRHHQHSDTHDDPHSPHQHGHDLTGMLRGLWHAHVGWIFAPEPMDLYRYVRDLAADRALRRVSSMFFVWVAMGLLIPTVLGGLLTMTWSGALVGFIWGGLIRILLVHHVTWSINSACHIWGRQPFRSHDHSRNNPIFGVLGLGEGWHNNHHAFPTSARHGLFWWQFDATWCVIRAMELMRLVTNVRVPAAAQLGAKRLR